MQSYRAIAFSRPGEAGIVPLIGALWAAEHNGLLSDANVWICPGVSSLIAIMTACGYKCSEIMAILIAIPEILSPAIPFKNPITLGANIDTLKNRFSDIIKNKIKFIPTLKEFSEKYDTILISIGFALEKQNIEYISLDSYPTMNLIDFLCISFSTPGIFRPYRYDGHHWIDGSIIEAFPIQSIDLEEGKILGISSLQDKINMKSEDPLTQIKNIMRSLFEASRFNSVKEYPNLTNVIIPDDDVSIYESTEISNPFTERIVLLLGEEIVGKLKCGWVEFLKVHFDNIRESEQEEAEKQE